MICAKGIWEVRKAFNGHEMTATQSGASLWSWEEDEEREGYDTCGLTAGGLRREHGWLNIEVEVLTQTVAAVQWNLLKHWHCVDALGSGGQAELPTWPS